MIGLVFDGSPLHGRGASRATRGMSSPMSAARTHVKSDPCSCIMTGGKEARDMGSPRKYAIVDPATGKLDRRIFSEQAIYDAEMEQIFGRPWLMIGHESLVPAPDDFFHTYMGEDPVILTRDGRAGCTRC